MLQKFNETDAKYGPLISWVFRLVLMLGLAAVSLYVKNVRLELENQFLTHSEVDQYIEEMHKMRQQDLSQIYSTIEEVRKESQRSDDILRSLEGNFERLNAHIEILFNRFDRLESKIDKSNHKN